MSFFTAEFIQSLYKSTRATWLGFVTVITAGIIVALIVHLVYGRFTDEKDIISFILILVLVLMAGMLIYGFSVYNERVKDAVTEGRHLPDKLNRHRSALAIFLVLCSLPIYIAVFGFIITGNYYLFVVVAMCFGSILMKAPTKERLISELKLSGRDKTDLG